MLVLSRKKGEVLQINDNIEIVVLESNNNQVRIGIKAPKEVRILRKEIIDQTKSSNKDAILDMKNISLLENIRNNASCKVGIAFSNLNSKSKKEHFSKNTNLKSEQ